MELFGGSTEAVLVGGALDRSMPPDGPVVGGLFKLSRSGVNFLRRPRFLLAASSKLSGGCPSSAGSRSLVFCTAKTVVGIIGSCECDMPSKLVLGPCDGGGCELGGSGRC